ncbi:MAG: Nif3-like dinuclear metal center hexameric protein [Candidatus Kapaibacterium sp.]|jgi:dinuclear metal center YbgI/SA1388 family protein
MHISDFVLALHRCLPPATAMEGDRLGLLVQSGRMDIHRLLVCLDVTLSVLEEAKVKGVDTILTFHPLIFSPLTSVLSDHRVGACVEYAIREGIAIISAHTNVDAHPRGTNAVFAERMGWKVETVLIPDTKFYGHGMGVICTLPEEEKATVESVVALVRSECGSPVRWSNGSGRNVQRIAVVCGSGSSFLQSAREARADVFVTADVRYHTFLEAEGKIAIIDPGHFEMEQFVPVAMKKIVEDEVLKGSAALEILVSQVSTNPLRYT